MTQKTKAIILIAIILSVTAVIGVYFFKKNKANIPAPQALITSQDTKQAQPAAGNNVTQTQPQEKQEVLVNGKVRSLNATQIFIELADGKGSAIGITPTTPVRIEGEDNVKNLSVLKPESIVSVKVDEKSNNAIEILIKK